MKTLIFLLVFCFALAASTTVFAATPAPTKKLTPTPAVTQEEKQVDTIEKIKDLVASKVAELKLVDKRGILGTVKSTTNTQIVIENNNKTQVMIDIDELTKFDSSEKDSFGISDVKEGDFLSFLGLYNKDSKRLLARFISYASNVPVNIEAVIIEKNTKEFTLEVVDTFGKKSIINVESSTKTNVYQDGETVKSGFTKVSEGERIIVAGFADKKEKDVINASRIIHFPDLPLSGDLTKHKDMVDTQVPVSSGSAGKVEPIIKR